VTRFPHSVLEFEAPGLEIATAERVKALHRRSAARLALVSQNG
jgi:hypothetical protein